jgi:hypothetical protein
MMSAGDCLWVYTHLRLVPAGGATEIGGIPAAPTPGSDPPAAAPRPAAGPLSGTVPGSAVGAAELVVLAAVGNFEVCTTTHISR